MKPKLTKEEAEEISAKLRKAIALLDEAYAIVRKKDETGMSDLSLNISSDRNNIDDTLFMIGNII